MAKSADQRILETASAHHGVINTAALQEANVGKWTVSDRVRSGLLVPVVKGIYIVPPLADQYTLVAAAQTAVPKAVVSHRTAARIHGMDVAEFEPELTRPRGSHLAIPGVHMHESRRLSPIDQTSAKGLIVTTPTRTLWDLGTTLGENLHRKVIQEEVARKRVSKDELVACHRAMARRGRKGTAAMRKQLLDSFDDEPFPESELERRVQQALDDRSAPPVIRQFRPPWYNGVSGIVDFADPVGKTIIEADGRRWHATELARRSDLQRDLTAGKHGWHTIRVGWQEIVHRADPVMDEIFELLVFRRTAAAA